MRGGGAPKCKLLKGYCLRFILLLSHLNYRALFSHPTNIKNDADTTAHQITQYKKKCAFTMAEILITLGVIGVIAALTIPNLARKWEERAIISKYKKMYATLANAYNRAVADNGDPEYWDLSDQASLMKFIEPYLNIKFLHKKRCRFYDIFFVTGKSFSSFINCCLEQVLMLQDF